MDTSQISDIAGHLAAQFCETLPQDPAKIEERLLQLQDLKQKIVECALESADGIEQNLAFSQEFIWSFATVMPDFEYAGLYEKRSSLAALAGAVFLGWIIGGLVAGLLNLFALGGDIIRAGAIFGTLWLNEYLGANPRARRIALTCLGLGGLTRFAGLLANGLIRFGGFAGFRQLVFGNMAKPGIFKGTWLLFGAFFLAIFFSKKVTGLNVAGFEQSLRIQIEQRLKLAVFMIEEISKRETLISKISASNIAGDKSPICPKGSCELANGILDIMDALDPSRKSFIMEKLAQAGFSQEGRAGQEFVWNNDRDGQLYIPMGFINDGDDCIILKPPRRVGDKVIKGHAQRKAE